MIKDTIVNLLTKRLEIADDQDLIEMLNELLTTIEATEAEHIESTFDEDVTTNSIRMYIDLGKHKQKMKRKKPQLQTYYKLEEVISNITDKAFSITTGSNNLSGSRYKEFQEWIPFSQIVKRNNNIYIPTWLISKNNLWDHVNKNDKIKA